MKARISDAALREAAARILDEARRTVPVDTGSLRPREVPDVHPDLTPLDPAHAAARARAIQVGPVDR